MVATLYDASDPTNPWKDHLMLTTDANGNVSLTVKSSDVISQPTLQATWNNSQNNPTVIGSARCDFAAVQKIRRFPNSTDPDETKDTGWLFDFPHFDTPDKTTPAKVYLKFMIDPSIGDVKGNWKYVNNHQLLVKVEDIDLQADTPVFSGNLNDYAIVVDPGNSYAVSRIVTTGQLPNSEGVYDGSAQVTVRAGPKIGNVAVVWITAIDQIQWAR